MGVLGPGPEVPRRRLLAFPFGCFGSLAGTTYCSSAKNAVSWGVLASSGSDVGHSICCL